MRKLVRRCSRRKIIREEGTGNWKESDFSSSPSSHLPAHIIIKVKLRIDIVDIVIR